MYIEWKVHGVKFTFSGYNSASFDTYVGSYNHHHNHHLPPRIPTCHFVASLSADLQPLESLICFCLSSFAFSRMSSKWKHTGCPWGPPCCPLYASFAPLQCCVMLLCTVVPKLVFHSPSEVRLDCWVVEFGVFRERATAGNHVQVFVSTQVFISLG